MRILHYRLWKVLIDKIIKQMKFRGMIIVGTSTLVRLGNDSPTRCIVPI